MIYVEAIKVDLTVCFCKQNVESGLKLQTDSLTSAIDGIKIYMTAYVAGNELNADFYAYVSTFLFITYYFRFIMHNDALTFPIKVTVNLYVMTCGYYRKNFLQVDLFYKELTQSSVSQQAAYTSENLLGLFLLII